VGAHGHVARACSSRSSRRREPTSASLAVAIRRGGVGPERRGASVPRSDEGRIGMEVRGNSSPAARAMPLGELAWRPFSPALEGSRGAPNVGRPPVEGVGPTFDPPRPGAGPVPSTLAGGMIELRRRPDR
jgi:hypothetical protein